MPPPIPRKKSNVRVRHTHKTAAIGCLGLVTFVFIVAALFVTAVFWYLSPTSQRYDVPLLEARAGHSTVLNTAIRDDTPLPSPPEHLLQMVKYPGPLGEMQAVLGRPQSEGQSAGIVWIIGGFPCGGIDRSAWSEPWPQNEQSAQAYRLAGVVMMYPTLRGSFGNPGSQEGFFGEVEDILAAVRFLRSHPATDPDRIYLGGHSTGATLALLVAATGEELAGVIAFGPIADPTSYGENNFSPFNSDERNLRAPVAFLSSIRSPTWVIEGEYGNIDSLTELREASDNPRIHFVEVPAADHFTVLHPVNRILAEQIASGQQLLLDSKAVTIP